MMMVMMTMMMMMMELSVTKLNCMCDLDPQISHHTTSAVQTLYRLTHWNEGYPVEDCTFNSVLNILY